MIIFRFGLFHSSVPTGQEAEWTPSGGQNNSYPRRETKNVANTEPPWFVRQTTVTDTTLLNNQQLTPSYSSITIEHKTKHCIICLYHHDLVTRPITSLRDKVNASVTSVEGFPTLLKYAGSKWKHRPPEYEAKGIVNHWTARFGSRMEKDCPAGTVHILTSYILEILSCMPESQERSLPFTFSDQKTKTVVAFLIPPWFDYSNICRTHTE